MAEQAVVVPTAHNPINFSLTLSRVTFIPLARRLPHTMVHSKVETLIVSRLLMTLFGSCIRPVGGVEMYVFAAQTRTKADINYPSGEKLDHNLLLLFSCKF